MELVSCECVKSFSKGRRVLDALSCTQGDKGESIRKFLHIAQEATRWAAHQQGEWEA